MRKVEYSAMILVSLYFFASIMNIIIGIQRWDIYVMLRKAHTHTLRSFSLNKNK